MVEMARIEKLVVNSPLFTFLHRDVAQKRLLSLARQPVEGPLLEIGCGQGATTEGLLSRLPGVSVVATDYDPEEVALAERRLAGRAKVERADATHLLYEDGAFATVVEMNALHHIPAWPQALREIRRVLKPGGQFLLMDYTRHSFLGAFAGTSLQPGAFTATQLADALRDAGFSSVVLQGRAIVFGRAVA